jgi:hypothetical protein
MDGIAEVVPDYAKVAGKLTQSSVITGRRRVRLVPQSGQTYTSGNSAGVVNILIQDGQAYADLLSACVSFNLTTYDGAAANTPPVGTTSVVVCDDGAYSVFRRALISVNSTLMDDTDFVAKKANAEIYATASQAWYNSVGSFLGLWKHNTNAFNFVTSAALPGTPATNDVVVSKYDIYTKANQLNGSWAQKTSNWSGATPGVAINNASNVAFQNQFSIPLSLLTSFFRNDTLFPCRNAGQLYVQLNLANALDALWNPNGSATAPNFTISNLTLELDFVDLHPTYLSMMDDIIEAPGGNGVQWAFDAHMVATQNLGAGSGQQSVIVSKASQNMRSLQVLVQPQAGQTTGAWLSQSTFSNPGAIDIQYRIGSLYYPAFTSVGEHRMFMDLQNAFGSPESIDKSGIVDTLNYYLSTGAGGNGTTLGQARLNNRGTMTTTNVSGSAVVNNWSFADLWTYSYCFDRLKHAKFHGVDLDGVNTLTSAGSQMVVQLNANVPEASVLTAIVRFTRVLKLAGGSTQVVG